MKKKVKNLICNFSFNVAQRLSIAEGVVMARCQPITETKYKS